MADSDVPGFRTCNDFTEFSKRVRLERRYATDALSRRFIDAVLATAQNRSGLIKKETPLYRAQHGVEEEEEKENGIYRTYGYDADRMVPKPCYVRGGRANPARIAYLYLSNNVDSAISEIRPWIGAKVSVAVFKVKRDLKALNLTEGHGSFGLLTLEVGKDPRLASDEEKRRAVWTDIDSAFSWPVSQDDHEISYIPTQILAEAFRGAGYEALVYRSNFEENTCNIVIFDVGAANIIQCTPYKINNVHFLSEKYDDIRYF